MEKIVQYCSTAIEIKRKILGHGPSSQGSTVWKESPMQLAPPFATEGESHVLFCSKNPEVEIVKSETKKGEVRHRA